MNRARLAIPFFLVVAFAATGCGAAGAPSPTPGPTSEPTAAAGGNAFLIRAAQAKPQACMEALITGKLTRNPGSGLGLTSPNSPPVVVEWPFRYSAREENGRVALLDETGTVVALEGEMVQMGGGMGQQNIWFTCGPVERLEAIR